MSKALQEHLNLKYTQVTVGNLSTIIISKNPYRRYLLIQNKSDEAIYIKIDEAVSGTEGIMLNAMGTEGDSIEFSNGIQNITTKDIYAVCASGSKDVLVVEGFTDNESAPVNIDFPLSLIQTITSDDIAYGDVFGYSVSIYGDVAVVGARYDDHGGFSNDGSAYVFYKDEGGTDNWGQVIKLVASDPATFDQFGFSVSISGDYIVVGAQGKDSLTGAAYVFYKDEGGADNWGQVKKIEASDKSTASAFGAAISIYGDDVIVGAQREDAGGLENIGAAYIFSKDKGGADNWGEVKKITASDGEAYDNFGNSVSIYGDDVIVGVYKKDAGGLEDAGSAYIFSRDQGGADNWGEVKKITASDGEANDDFGYSVSIYGDDIVVSAYKKDAGDTDSGAAYIFSRDQGGTDNWGQVKKIVASDPAAYDYFGYSTSIYGDYIVVGAQGKDDSKGAAYIYNKNQGGTNNWGQLKKTTDPTETASAQFGLSVSINNDKILISATGVGTGGAAFVYEF